MVRIGPYSFQEYLKTAESFHGYPAPGILVGGFMVDLAIRHMPKGILIDAISETTTCLPDAIQLLTPCTIGNGWLRILNLGRFALTLFEKYEGEGVRVFIDPAKLKPWSEIESWLMKLKPKAEQDNELLLSQIEEAGSSICGMQTVRVQSRFRGKKRRGGFTICALCGEPYPKRDGAVCRACQGEAPYELDERESLLKEDPPLRAITPENAIGKRLLHDMTMVISGESKGPAFLRGYQVTAGDLCRLQQMGRQSVYVEEGNDVSAEWVHENEAALEMALRMAGDGIMFDELPKEGRITFRAARDGLFIVQEDQLERFNMIPGVMCASRKTCSVVSKGRQLAATRAIPLLLPKVDMIKALAVLHDGPLFSVVPMRAAQVAILVTGSEVFQGLIEDRFAPIVTAKVEKYGCRVVGERIVPDDRNVISRAAMELIETGADLLITTAGLSVDPDDVTRQGLLDAGAEDLLYGAPIIPGAMTLLARIGDVPIMGVPACALYFKTTAFDLLLPRVLAGLTISRRDLAKIGHGSFCLGCKSCTFPKCPFGG